MEEIRNCGHEQDEMCSCIRNTNVARQLVFFAGNIRFVSWEFDYGTLEEPENVRLCIVGNCGKCGGRLCYGLRVGGEFCGEALIESVYDYLNLFHKLDGLSLDRQTFDAGFLRLFHDADHAAAQAWLNKRQSV